MKKPNLQKREYALISICIGMMFLFPLQVSLVSTENFSEYYTSSHQLNLTKTSSIDGVQTTEIIPKISQTPSEYFIMMYERVAVGFTLQTISGYGWWMPLVIFIVMLTNFEEESTKEFPPLLSTHYLPMILPIVSAVMVIKFSTGISPWRSILYAHIIASGIGVYAMMNIWPNLLS
jgi:hypothetical protein